MSTVYKNIVIVFKFSIYVDESSTLCTFRYQVSINITKMEYENAQIETS